MFTLEEGLDGRSSPVALGTLEAVDPDGGPVRYELAAGDRTRFAVDAVSGAVTYIGPGEDPGAGPYRLRVTATDPDGDDATANVEVLVIVVNAPPEAADDTAETDEDTPVVIDVLDNDTDPDGDALAVTGVSAPAHGTAAPTPDGAVTYTPDPDFHGSDSFTYTVGDGSGLTDQATVTVTVRPVDDPPGAADDTAETDEDTPVVIDVLANDTDPDGDPLTVTEVSAPEHGAARITPNGAVEYTPRPDHHGTDRFIYVASGGAGLIARAAVTVTVHPVDDPPEADDDEAETAEDTPVAIDVLDNDSDLDGDALTVTEVSAPAHGTAVLRPGGQVEYTPEADHHGTDRFTYVVSSGTGLTDEAAVTVTVLSVNDPPEAVDDAAETAEDAPVAIDVLANDTDPEDDPITVTVISAPAHGTAVRTAAGAVEYTPHPDYHGPDRFTYVVGDGSGLTDQAAVEVTVLPVNDAPQAVGAIPDQALEAGDGPTTLDLGPYFEDRDGDALGYTAVASPEAVALSLAGATLTLSVARPGGATVTVTARDAGGLTAEQAFLVTTTDRRARGVLEDTLAAMGRGHLASARATLRRRAAATGRERSRVTVAGVRVPLGADDAAATGRAVAERWLMGLAGGLPMGGASWGAMGPGGPGGVGSGGLGALGPGGLGAIGPGGLGPGGLGAIGPGGLGLGGLGAIGPGGLGPGGPEVLGPGGLGAIGPGGLGAIGLGEPGAFEPAAALGPGGPGTLGPGGALGLTGGAAAAGGPAGGPALGAAGSGRPGAPGLGSLAGLAPFRGGGHSEFLLAFGQDGDGDGTGRRWTVWGQLDVQAFRGERSPAARYDGDLRTAYAGFDARLGERWLAGVAVTRSNARGDWSFGSSMGRLTTRLTSLQPYLRWSDGGTSVWATAGGGAGSVRNERLSYGLLEESGLGMRLGLVELRRRLATVGPGVELALRGDASWASLATDDGSQLVDALQADVHQLRVGLDVSRLLQTAGGASVEPFGEVHARHDGGAGQTGAGIEVAGGLRVARGLFRIEGMGRLLGLHAAERYREHGAAVTLSVGEGARRPGLTLSLSPRWGAPATASDALWRDQLYHRQAAGGAGGGRDEGALDTRVDYGLELPSGGLLTPFGLYGRSQYGQRMQVGLFVDRLGPLGLEVSGERYAPMPASFDEYRMTVLGSITFGGPDAAPARRRSGAP